jgi:stearoyl-CoA desaturase (Delta-9 desaturase)
VTRSLLVVFITSFVLAQIATGATSIYLHRALAHRSLTLHPFVAVLFRAVLWLLTGQSRQQWVAVHRKHHSFADREGDPHSPLLRILAALRLVAVGAPVPMRVGR